MKLSVKSSVLKRHLQRAQLLRCHLHGLVLVAWPLAPGETFKPQPPVAGFGKVGHSAKPPGTLAMLHTDHDTGHPPREVNYLLPVSLRTYGSNSLWVESAQGLGDYAPFEMSYGEMVQWRGKSLRHYSHRSAKEAAAD